MSRSQNAKLLAALQERPLTSLEIWRDLGIARASARVFDLRQAGFLIASQEVTVRNRDGVECRVARYTLQRAQTTMLPVHPGRGVMTHA